MGDERLRVATLNIWNKSGPWPERVELIRRELRHLQPDVVGLQEVLRFMPEQSAADAPSVLTCQATEIATELGYRVAYGPASNWQNGLFFGNAVLTRYPIQDSENIALPGAESGETRSMLYAGIDTPYGTLPVFVTHLNWKLHHGSVRVRQVQAIAEHIFRLAPVDESKLPPVLLGDFNAEPDSDEIRYLRGLTSFAGKTVYFADAWVYAGDGSSGATFDRTQNAFAALAHEPPRRIDYIFVRGPDRQYRGEPLSTRLAFTTPFVHAEGKLWASDHFGLFTELSAAARKHGV